MWRNTVTHAATSEYSLNLGDLNNYRMRLQYQGQMAGGECRLTTATQSVTGTRSTKWEECVVTLLRGTLWTAWQWHESINMPVFTAYPSLCRPAKTQPRHFHTARKAPAAAQRAAAASPSGCCLVSVKSRAAGWWMSSLLACGCCCHCRLL